MSPISSPAIAPVDVQEPCGAGELATTAVFVVTTALVVLVAIVCAIYLR